MKVSQEKRAGSRLDKYSIACYNVTTFEKSSSGEDVEFGQVDKKSC
jgi:hypothetical protein